MQQELLVCSPFEGSTTHTFLLLVVAAGQTSPLLNSCEVKMQVCFTKRMFYLLFHSHRMEVTGRKCRKCGTSADCSTNHHALQFAAESEKVSVLTPSLTFSVIYGSNSERLRKNGPWIQSPMYIQLSSISFYVTIFFNSVEDSFFEWHSVQNTEISSHKVCLCQCQNMPVVT